ncbi:glutathione S-transferase zeta class-like [Pyrus communis]|uniref:glutathione S-transferase zeta class-like n=1 Tax=Pyrus communis TaxID=23211 RepID=UPI0035C0E2C9
MAFVKIAAIFFFFSMALTLSKGYIDFEHACIRINVHIEQAVQDSEPPDDRISGYSDEIKVSRTSPNPSSTGGASHDRSAGLPRLPCEYKPVNLPAGEQFIPEFKCLNHLHFVPVLVDGDTVVSDSFAILLYLGDKYPQRLLLPADPRLKALKLQERFIISSSMQPLHLPSVLKYLTEKFDPEESQSWAQSNIEKGFFALEALLKDFDSRYATGDDVYMVSNLNTADVFLAPQIVVATTRFNINMRQL